MELYRGENMKRSTILWILLALTLILPAVSAATVCGSRAVTLGGPSGILVPLGFENFMSLAQARFWYNWICVIILLPIAAVASKRNYEQFGVFIPVVAAILLGFGWLQTANMVQTTGAIIATGFMGGALYMKGQLRQTWGLGGPGSTIMNIVVFMIILSAVFGLVNSQAIWRENTGVQSNQFLNVNLEAEVTQLANAGGALDDAIDLAWALVSAGIASLKVLLSIILCVGCFEAAILLMYPWVIQSALLVGILSIFQVGLYIMMAKLMNDIFYAKSIYATEF